jgi:hypothetical protein
MDAEYLIYLLNLPIIRVWHCLAFLAGVPVMAVLIVAVQSGIDTIQYSPVYRRWVCRRAGQHVWRGADVIWEKPDGTKVIGQECHYCRYRSITEEEHDELTRLYGEPEYIEPGE